MNETNKKIETSTEINKQENTSAETNSLDLDLNNENKNLEAIDSSLMVNNPIWLSVSEAAKLGGVQDKTIRRAIKSKTIRYRVIANRYSIDFKSLIDFLHQNTKLKNKLNHNGLGQYIEIWKKE